MLLLRLLLLLLQWLSRLVWLELLLRNLGLRWHGLYRRWLLLLALLLLLIYASVPDNGL